jgi:2-polyprenyl-3-methyl-5-hydroxy-6-metoxy-1,4-benzoquinol methylase
MIETCPVCGADNPKLLFKATPIDYSSNKLYDIAKCQACGHGFTISAQYHAEDYEGGSYDAKEKFWHRLVKPLLTGLERSKISYFRTLDKKKPAILEIGSGKGRFIKMLTEKGYSAYGIEPSRRSFEVARSQGCDTIFNCTIQQMHAIPDLNRKYDLVILWHVLEHLEDPSENLNLLKGFLSAKGAIIVAVPNFDSWQATGGKSDWYHLDPSRHVSHFTPGSLNVLAKNNSLEVKKIFFNSFYQDCVGEIMTYVNKVLPYKNIVFNTSRLNGNYFRKTGKPAAVLWFLLASGLSIALIPFAVAWTLVTEMQKKSGTMIAVMEKAR